MSGFLRTISILLCLCPLCSCTRPAQDDGTTFRDSAGVTVATAETPAWSPGEGWRVSEEPVVEIGALEGPEESILSDVSGAVRLSDGRIVVADRGSLTLRFYSPTGEFLFRSGREGDGPGEFRGLGFLGVLPGDSLLTYDGAAGRIQLFDPFGTFLRSLALRSSWPGFFRNGVIGVLDERRIAVKLRGTGTEKPIGVQRWPPEMVVALDLATGAADSIVVVPGMETVTTGEFGWSIFRLPFGIMNGFAARAGRVAVISTETIGAKVYSGSGGLERIIRHPVPARPATQEDWEDWLEEWKRSPYRLDGSPYPAEGVEQLLWAFEQSPRADTWPQLRSVDFDAEGNLWLEREFGDPRPPYYVFSPEGLWLGQLTLPPGRKRCFQFGKDFVLGVWTDEMDVQYLRMYALIKG